MKTYTICNNKVTLSINNQPTFVYRLGLTGLETRLFDSLVWVTCDWQSIENTYINRILLLNTLI